MSISWEKIEKAFRLFFPEFSNKVTWVVVIAGISLTSGSILQSIVNSVLEKQYNIRVLGEYDSLVGIILVFFALIHNILLQREKTKLALNAKNESNHKAIEHDMALFNKLDGILNDEYLMRFFHNVVATHAFYSSKLDPLVNFMYEIDKVKTQFISKSISTALEDLKPITIKLHDFIILEFCEYGRARGDDEKLCLQPYLNCDRGGRWDDHEGRAEYAKSVSKMSQLINDYSCSYKRYRKAVKLELFV
ncbi:hypothetical protein [Vibrio cholerae]|uniref:hypothetical protein n=1 Tax=Vibrio cholerae TaxID=666 RepID=UPI000903139D|nr:hypothetical protein [Vibrio cholerae]